MLKNLPIRKIINEKISGLFDVIRNGASIQQTKDPIGIPITRIETIATGEIDLNRLGYAGITDESFSDFYLRDGDILMSHINSIPHLGKVALVSEDKKIIHGMNLLCLKPKRKFLNPNYAFYYFKGPAFKTDLKRITKKSVNQASFNITALKEVQIPLPPLEDQVRIAHLLGKVEDLIAQRKKDLSQLDQLLKSVFLEMFGDPVRNEKGWEKNALSKITEQVVDCPHSTPKWTAEGAICLRTSNLGHGAWNWADTRFVDEIQYQQRISRSEILPGDIILSREGTVGVLALVSEGMKLCMGQRLVQVRANQYKILPLFLLHLLLMELAPERIRSLMAGSTSQHLNMKDLRALGCMVPPITLQNKFSTIVEKMESIKSLFQTSLAELESLYGVLSQKAFQGELDLSRVPIGSVVQMHQLSKIHPAVPA